MVLTEAILTDFRQGRLETFYQAAYPSLLCFAQRLLGEGSAIMAEDCVQDVILRSYERRQQIATPQQWKTFLYTSVHNSCVSIQRHQQVHQRFAADAQMAEPSFQLDITHQMMEQETLDLLFSVIESLPDRLQRIFSLSFEQGLHNDEIAQQIGLSVSAVKKQKRQLLDKVRQRLSEHQLLLCAPLLI